MDLVAGNSYDRKEGTDFSKKQTSVMLITLPC
jgi:hypothetical protein